MFYKPSMDEPYGRRLPRSYKHHGGSSMSMLFPELPSSLRVAAIPVMCLASQAPIGNRKANPRCQCPAA